jgi:hypothetical protein
MTTQTPVRTTVPDIGPVELEKVVVLKPGQG